MLQQHSVRLRIFAELLERAAHLAGRSLHRKAVDGDFYAHALAGAREVAQVREARLVLTYEDDGEFGPNAPLAERARARGELGAQLSSEASSVENQGGHAVGGSSSGGEGPSFGPQIRCDN